MKKGSLQEKCGNYYAVFRRNGKQKWVNLHIPTVRGNKRKAEEALQAELLKYENSDNDYPDILFTDFMSEWIRDIKDVIKPSTYETYECTVNSKIIPYFKKKKYLLTDVEPRHITDFLKYLKLHGKNNGSGLSEKSVKNVHGILSVAFKYAKKNHMVASNPVTDSTIPTFENNIRKQVVIYTPAEVRKLLSFAKDTDSHVYLFLLLALSTGARRGELLALTWDDIDFEKKTISINKSRTGTSNKVTRLVTTPKTNASNRIIPISNNLLSELEAEKERQQADKLFFKDGYNNEYNFVIRNRLGEPYKNLGGISRVVYRIMENAGLKHCTIHGLRHTVASALDSMGVPIQEISILLGHEDSKTTEKVYIHRKNTISRSNIGLLDKLYGTDN